MFDRVLPFFLLTFVCLPSWGWAAKPAEASSSLEEFLPPLKESTAYKRYLHRPRTEMSKLLYLFDRFLNTDFKVVYDGTTYDSKTAIYYGRIYVAKNYHGEKAIHWLKIHAYRSQPRGKIIYLKYPNGKKRPLRDVLLEELGALEKIYPPLK